MKSKLNKLMIMLLFILFIVTSYSRYITIKYLDDILVIIIGILELINLFRQKKSSSIRFLLLFLFLEIINFVISYFYFKWYAVQSFLTFIKIIILIGIPFVLTVDKKYKDKILKGMFVISIPNLIIGVYQFFITNFAKTIIDGKYELINGVYRYRLNGATTHTLYYALLLVALIIYILFNSKSKHKIFLTSICFILCVFTYSSFAIMTAAIIITIKILLSNKRIKSLIQKNSKKIIYLGIIISLIFIYHSMLGEPMTIRYVATNYVIKNLNLYTLTIGNKFGKYLYLGYSEAYIMRVIFETGIIGLTGLLLIIYKLIKKQADMKNYGGVIICIIYVLNMFINEGYIVPYLVMIPLICVSITEGEKKYEKNSFN